MQSKLHLPHIGRSEDLSGGRTENIAIGINQIDVIRGVVVLPFEFKRFGFRQLEHLPQRKVKLVKARSPE